MNQEGLHNRINSGLNIKECLEIRESPKETLHPEKPQNQKLMNPGVYRTYLKSGCAEDYIIVGDGEAAGGNQQTSFDQTLVKVEKKDDAKAQETTASPSTQSRGSRK